MPESEDNISRDFTRDRSRRRRDPELQSPGESPDKNAELVAALAEHDLTSEEGTAARRDARSNVRKQAAADGNVSEFGAGEEHLSVLPIPGTETETMVDMDSLKLIARAETDRVHKETAGWAKEDETYIFFLQCEFGHQGIYFTEKPRQMTGLGRGKWFSAYKPKADSEFPLMLRCQVCEKFHNRLTPLAGMVNLDQTISFEQERIYRVPRDPVRARREGISRGFPSRWASNNLWQAEHAKKVKEIEADAAAR